MPPPREPSDTAFIAEIEEAIAPLRLPRQVRRFWERVDPPNLGVQPSIDWASPAFALDGWRDQREEFPGGSPANLLTLGYQSWCYMAVELDEPGCERGTIFEWSNPDSDFVPRWRHLADWLDGIAAIVHEGKTERRPGWRALSIDEATERAVSERALAGESPARIERDPDEWPERWLRAKRSPPS